jgi:hypothetical protein
MAVKVTHTSPEITSQIRAMVERDGVRPVGRTLRLADATVARLAAGLPVTEGVAELAKQRLAAIQEKAA